MSATDWGAFAVGVELEDDDRYVVTLSGEIDIAARGPICQVVDAVLAAGARSLVIDMQAVEFCDSTGAAVVLHAWRARNAVDGGPLDLVVRPSHRVLRVLELLGLNYVHGIRIEEPPRRGR